MSQLNERIAQFRKMATDDPTNELGHFRLGQLLMEDGQFAEAVQSFRRTLELSPQFSKVFQLMGRCLLQMQKKPEAIEVLRHGVKVADERGDNLPRDEMIKMLTELGEQPPVVAQKRPQQSAAVAGGGFQCSRPDCLGGAYARQLPRPPMGGELGQRIYQSVCADCWNDWIRNFSVKVINEMRLDLSSDHGAEEYDNIMKQTLGLT